MAFSFRYFALTATACTALLAGCSTFFHADEGIRQQQIDNVRATQKATIFQIEETDVIHSAWASFIEDETPDAHLPADYYERISAWLTLAEQYHIKSQMDTVSFVLLGTYLGWRFDQMPKLHEFFMHYDPDSSSFTNIVDDIMDEKASQWPNIGRYPTNLPFKEQVPRLDPNMKWDTCRDRCQVPTLITQPSDDIDPAVHFAITNVAGRPWITVLGINVHCHSLEAQEEPMRINNGLVMAHVYCPLEEMPNAIAVDFPDDISRNKVLNAILSEKPITLESDYFDELQIETSGIHDVLSTIGLPSPEKNAASIATQAQ